jgi:hypothetical protein
MVKVARRFRVQVEQQKGRKPKPAIAIYWDGERYPHDMVQKRLKGIQSLRDPKMAKSIHGKICRVLDRKQNLNYLIRLPKSPRKRTRRSSALVLVEIVWDVQDTPHRRCANVE